MSEATQIESNALLQLRPSKFLAERGCLNEAGAPRDDLSGNFATAACKTFENAELAPKSCRLFMKQSNSVWRSSTTPTPRKGCNKPSTRRSMITADLLGKKINPALVAWIREWIPFINSEASIAAFLRHMTAVVQQYTLIISLKHGN